MNNDGIASDGIAPHARRPSCHLLLAARGGLPAVPLPVREGMAYRKADNGWRLSEEAGQSRQALRLRRRTEAAGV